MISYMLYKFFDFFFQILYLLLFIRIMLSWIPHDPHHKVITFIYGATEPILRPFQSIFPASGLGGIDISPIFAFIAIGMVKKLIFMVL